MTTLLQEDNGTAGRRWVIGIVIVAAIALVALLLIPRGTPAPDQENQPKPMPAVTTVYYNPNAVTRVVLADGTVVFDYGWSEDDHYVFDRGYNMAEDNITVNLYDLPAVASTPAGKATGETYVTVNTNDLMAMIVKAFNAAWAKTPDGDKGPRATLDDADLTASGMLRFVLESADLDKIPAFQFTTKGKPEVRTNATAADGYRKGLAAWQVAQGSPWYDADEEYGYDFMCATYTLKPLDNTSALKALKELWPSLDLRLTTGDMTSPSPSRSNLFVRNGEVTTKTEVPCGIETLHVLKGGKPKGKGPTEPPRPTAPPSMPPKDNPQPEPKPSWPGGPKNPDQPG